MTLLSSFALGRKKEAIASYGKAIEFKSDKHEAWSNRGISLDDLGRNEEAIASYDKAIEGIPVCHFWTGISAIDRPPPTPKAAKPIAQPPLGIAVPVFLDRIAVTIDRFAPSMLAIAAFTLAKPPLGIGFTGIELAKAPIEIPFTPFLPFSLQHSHFSLPPLIQRRRIWCTLSV